MSPVDACISNKYIGICTKESVVYYTLSPLTEDSSYSDMIVSENRVIRTDGNCVRR